MIGSCKIVIQKAAVSRTKKLVKKYFGIMVMAMILSMIFYGK